MNAYEWLVLCNERKPVSKKDPRIPMPAIDEAEHARKEGEYERAMVFQALQHVKSEQPGVNPNARNERIRSRMPQL